jgi:cob(I)alamin adenosyltransferase
MTGRNAPSSIIEKADTVSEVKMIKHAFEYGIPAMEGIEK